MNQTRGMIMIQKLAQARKQLDGTQNDSSFKRVSDEQESECTQSDDKTNEEDVLFAHELAPAWNWY